MEDVPEFVQEWVRQLLDNAALLAAGEQVEVRLYTQGGKVRKRPVIIFNSGSTELT